MFIYRHIQSYNISTNIAVYHYIQMHNPFVLYSFDFPWVCLWSSYDPQPQLRNMYNIYIYIFIIYIYIFIHACVHLDTKSSKYRGLLHGSNLETSLTSTVQLGTSRYLRWCFTYTCTRIILETFSIVYICVLIVDTFRWFNSLQWKMMHERR